jgi:tetratricopeptide (TPR) repeat protein
MPAVFILLYLHKNRNNIRLKTILKHILPMIPLLIIIVFMNEEANGRNYLQRDFAYTNFEHLIFAGFTYCSYWVKGIFPFPLAVFYPAPSENLPHLPYQYYFLFLGSCLFLFLLIYHFLKKQNNLFFALGFYSFTVLPMLDLMYFPLKDLPMLVSNRYFYHTGIGILLYLVLIVDYLIGSKKIKIILASVWFTLFLIFFEVHLPDFRNQFTMYENDAKYYPSEVTLYRLAIIYEREGKTEKAIKYLHQGDQLHTNIWINNAWPYYLERSRLYYKAGEYQKALKDINTALAKKAGKYYNSDSLIGVDKAKIEKAILKN